MTDSERLTALEGVVDDLCAQLTDKETRAAASDAVVALEARIDTLEAQINSQVEQLREVQERMRVLSSHSA